MKTATRECLIGIVSWARPVSGQPGFSKSRAGWEWTESPFRYGPEEEIVPDLRQAASNAAGGRESE
jgi:hypothetical protein